MIERPARGNGVYRWIEDAWWLDYVNLPDLKFYCALADSAKERQLRFVFEGETYVGPRSRVGDL